MNWLDHGRTLREQGVEEIEMLLLRRKFFYSDQNVDSRDPVQLNLLYVQVRHSLNHYHYLTTIIEAKAKPMLFIHLGLFEDVCVFKVLFDVNSTGSVISLRGKWKEYCNTRSVF